MAARNPSTWCPDVDRTSPFPPMTRGLVVRPEVSLLAQSTGGVQTSAIHQVRRWLATWFGVGGAGCR